MELDGVAVRYGRRAPWILRDVSGVIAPGETVQVSGRNGVGKSTLLLALAGLLPVGRGTITDRPAAVGWVPEKFPTAQPFTVRSYLAAMANVRGLKNPAIEKWAERLFLTSFLDTRLRELSKGTAQKVGLVQALLAPPDLLILDEPWEGLDAQARAVLPDIVREVTEHGGSCVFSDHLGQSAGLPQLRQWSIVDGTVVESTETAHHVIEIVVSAQKSATTVAALRAAGHHVRSVRETAR